MITAHAILKTTVHAVTVSPKRATGWGHLEPVRDAGSIPQWPQLVSCSLGVQRPPVPSPFLQTAISQLGSLATGKVSWQDAMQQRAQGWR